MADDPLFAVDDVGRDLALVDWSATPLGATVAWPKSLRTIVQAVLTSRFSMWMAWGPDLTFFCNAAYRRDTLGAKYPWALGRPARDVWAEIWPDIGPRIDHVLRTGQATWDEALLLFLERSGYREETYHTFSYSPLRDDNGEVAGMLCVVSEDTERVISARRMATLRGLGSEPLAERSEADVIAAAERTIADNPRSLPFSLLYLFDDDGAARLAGATGWGGHPTSLLLQPQRLWPLGDLLAGTEAVIELGMTQLVDVPSGEWTDPPSQAFAVPMRQQGSGRPYGFIVVGVNPYRPLDEGYRDFVRLMAGQIGTGLAAARAYEAERHRAEILAELDRAKTTFFTNISHEFRTPLTLLLGPAEDALADTAHPLPGVQRRRVEVVARNAERLLKLVNTLLDFSRHEAGRADPRFVVTDIVAATRDLVGMFDSAFRRAGLDLVVTGEDDLAPVYVDPEMWAKIVLNLLSNALKFTFEGGVTVDVRSRGELVEVSVSDTGIGIAGEDQARLFERFHRVAGAASRTHEGSGIGLALVAELVDLHGADIRVDSEPGRGSTFTITLPFGLDRLPAEKVGTAEQSGTRDLTRSLAAGFLAEVTRWVDDPPPPEAAGEPNAKHEDRPRILVVEDNADMRAYVAGLLSDAYDVSTAVDGADGLTQALASVPDLVLSDVMMPGLDGFGLLSALRADPLTRDVPLIMLSARAGEEGTIEGLDAGANDYVIKPFSSRELLARVRANLEFDTAKRMRAELEDRQMLLDQTQRLAGVGSWELDLTTGAINASEEFARQIQISLEELHDLGIEHALALRLHSEDRDTVRSALDAAARGAPYDVEVRLVLGGGEVRTFRSLGEVVRDPDGRPVRLRGSHQDITAQRESERAIAEAAAAREASEGEHRIADELQARLLPSITFEPDGLEVATYYRAGVEGTLVGGDWYDVIELGAGRTALVMGDVMGRGVPAAAVMGQLRSAIRAYARLDLSPVHVLESLDGVVRDLGDDHIVTCIYAVFDPGGPSVVLASAGHLPPLIVTPGGDVVRFDADNGPPLGAGPFSLRETEMTLAPGSVVALYTDGLVERRGAELDAGVQALATVLSESDGPLAHWPEALVNKLVGAHLDDDVAVLLARVAPDPHAITVATYDVRGGTEDGEVGSARAFLLSVLEHWGATTEARDDVALVGTELVTNALLHGRGPVRVRVLRRRAAVVVEVHDTATTLPRRMQPTEEDEHGRGIQIVSLLGRRWGVRPTTAGKAVWCELATTLTP